ncbi:efflux transporter outer membrane subunit [Novosphingobium sp. 1949]|uniref:Efflux transporter outer membrane subunit n=1 Tax=Novosphingobium organovorum TaxID=2930092 RepID=A0ABT0BC91_9SPHN|nr:efflux transporter outer membrane subunit [Novosphingobium organovorum]MCJ2182680.1 efflux transporter outer membrane subunit [Novosphingobium organovorum]
MPRTKLLTALCLAGAFAPALAGCDMAPKYVAPANPAPPQWPQGAAYPAASEGDAGLPWRTVFADERLQKVIAMALANNQDLAATLANVASARAQYHVERSYQLPTIAGGADASVTEAGLSQFAQSQSYSADVGASSFELDLFGRVKNQSRQYLETYLSTQSGYRSARLTLVANVATAYVTLASDRDLLALAKKTEASATHTLTLQQTLYKNGLTDGATVASAETVVEQARSDVASQTTLVAQDRNALELLTGGPIEDALLPASLLELEPHITTVPAGLSSTVLLQRPDVVEAEHELKSTYAQIGAARAAFFPTISLTGTLGFASTALSSLFTGGAFTATGSGSASLPILGGETKGNLEYAKAQRDYYLANYRSTVQSAFKDVADGLARRGTIADQRRAQDRLVDAAQRSYRLSDQQYRAGIGTYLDALTAQRELYADQQTRIATVLADLTNRVTLYSAIGADASLGEDDTSVK